ncbi:hypothetical protein MVES1_002888 [Malassezia vespertilionis]|uniref:Uncharacterized protein n=1 Tax=Malassezia vespertilionis TaxID=2020962 RepID=A0A2N1J997_9BASI|nr:uncharacterized protein MVES1_002888 [Malassezia vespertilionis]PKI83116.1 hypothetical protein MVES_002737 [Malassezia vespertilionis]WFD07522.1 hypothetical protein MVES1_002888 [Malassezia vespertilionis]
MYCSAWVFAIVGALCTITATADTHRKRAPANWQDDTRNALSSAFNYATQYAPPEAVPYIAEGNSYATAWMNDKDAQSNTVDNPPPAPTSSAIAQPPPPASPAPSPAPSPMEDDRRGALSSARSYATENAPPGAIPFIEKGNSYATAALTQAAQPTPNAPAQKRNWKDDKSAALESALFYATQHAPPEAIPYILKGHSYAVDALNRQPAQATPAPNGN